MDFTVVNAVVCEQILVARKLSLVNVGPRWTEPPANLAVWTEIHNPGEGEFTVRVEVWRAKHFVGESPLELVLPGQRHWQSTFQWERIYEFKRKTYTFVILVTTSGRVQYALTSGRRRTHEQEDLQRKV